MNNEQNKEGFILRITFHRSGSLLGYAKWMRVRAMAGVLVKITSRLIVHVKDVSMNNARWRGRSIISAQTLWCITLATDFNWYWNSESFIETIKRWVKWLVYNYLRWFTMEARQQQIVDNLLFTDKTLKMIFKEERTRSHVSGRLYYKFNISNRSWFGNRKE